MAQTLGIAERIRVWLDEEWEPLEVHRQLGEEAAAIYKQLRNSGEDDLGSLLLGLGDGLRAFEYSETYTGPFEVANKVAELLMVRMGREVGCLGKEERKRIEDSL